MELVYLWVEDYKNIKNQGFNFSSRFRCEYDENTNELNIIDKDKTGEFYPKNFFGENVNVTAIVGENGSGKSSILESLIYLIDSTTNLKDKNNFLIIYYNNEWNILTHSSINFKLILDGIHQKINKINPKNGTINCLLSIFVNCITDLTHSMRYRQLGEFFENYKNGIQPKVKEYKFDDVEKENFVIKFLDLLVDENSFFDFLDKKLIFDRYYFFAPIQTNIVIKENNQCKLLKELNSKIYEEKDNIKLIFLLRIILSNVIELLRNEIINYTDTFIEILSNKYKNIDLNKFDYQSYKEICETTNNYLNSIKNEAYIKIHQKEVEFITKLSKFDKLYIDNLFKVWKFDKYEQDVYTETFEITKDIFHDKNELFKLLFEKNYIKIDFFRNKNVSYQQLSSGEKLYLKHFTNIAYSVKYFQKDTQPMYLMLLDEIELSFHPEWQKKIISSIENIVKKLNEKNKKFNLILTSHSPFILSDLTKENVIFLEKGKQVYPFDDGKQTFGANIHTLLSHGFFMKDGLMGEFAKSKIDDVINYLNNKESKIKNDDYAQNIIDIIGEPIIKRELQRMLKNKMELSNKTEIDTIKNEIKLLTKRLEDLEKDGK